MRNGKSREITHAASFGGAVPGSFIPAMAHLARRISAQGDRMNLVMLDVPGATWPDMIIKSGANLILVRTPKETSLALKSLRSDIVHTHFSDFDVPAVITLGLSSTRLFWHIHSWPATQGALSSFRSFVKYNVFGQRVEAFVPVSYALAGEYARRGVSRSKLRVVPNGIDCNWFRPPTESERLHARAALGLDGEKAILFFGRVRSKGGDVLWRALERVNRAKVLLVEVPEQDKAEFEKRATVVTISRSDDVRSLYWAADVLAYPTRMEGFGFVLMESIATGLPVVASDIPPVREMAVHAPDIRLVPVDDSAALSMSIREVLGNVRTDSPSSRAVTMHSLERWATQMLELYE